MCEAARPQRAPPKLTTIKLLEFVIERRLVEVDNSTLHSQGFVFTGLLVVAVELDDRVASLELVEAGINGVAVAELLRTLSSALPGRQKLLILACFITSRCELHWL